VFFNRSFTKHMSYILKYIIIQIIMYSQQKLNIIRYQRLEIMIRLPFEWMLDQYVFFFFLFTTHWTFIRRYYDVWKFGLCFKKIQSRCVVFQSIAVILNHFRRLSISINIVWKDDINTTYLLNQSCHTILLKLF
jgi:hypothetical protein